MKRLLTLALLFIGLNSFANRTETKASNTNNKVAANTVVASEAASAATLNQLQLENRMLLTKLMALEQANEEIKSQANYNLVMHAVINGLVTERQQQVLDELNARLAYEKTMATMLLSLGRK